MGCLTLGIRLLGKAALNSTLRSRAPWAYFLKVGKSWQLWPIPIKGWVYVVGTKFYGHKYLIESINAISVFLESSHRIL